MSAQLVVHTVGRCHEVDPFTGHTRQTNVVSTGGNYESFAYDDQDPDAPYGVRYFTTEDSDRGALTRYTPAAAAYETGNNYDILTSSGGTYEYLLLNPSDNTFTWTTSRSAGRSNANAYFRASEGIDVHNRILSFTAKTNKQLFTLDLEAGTYVETSTVSGLFNLVRLKGPRDMYVLPACRTSSPLPPFNNNCSNPTKLGASLAKEISFTSPRTVEGVATSTGAMARATTSQSSGANATEQRPLDWRSARTASSCTLHSSRTPTSTRSGARTGCRSTAQSQKRSTIA